VTVVQPRANHVIGTAATAEQPRLVKLGQLLDQAEADAEAAHEAFTAGRPRGPITGLASLDRELGGWLQPGLHILHSNSGTGKTALGWQAVTVAKHPALFVSCEMGALELLRRLTARVTDTYLGRLKSGELSPTTARRLYEQAVAATPNAYLVDATRAYADAGYLLGVAKLAKGESNDFLLVLDSLHSWVEMLPDERTSEYDAINNALASLRLLAHQLVCPVLVIAERNRGSMKEGGINAGAGSRRIEFGSESVISLDRKGMPDLVGDVTVELVLDKNRHGASGKKVNVKFNGATQRFTEADR
jgi:replicative DNA helicase